MSATEGLARYVVHATPADLPTAAVKAVKRALLDCLGVTLAGSVEPGAEILCEYLREVEAGPVASVIGRGFRTSPTAAALANGFMAHALDYDDISTAMTGHPSVCLMPSVFALGEALGSTGMEVLLAYALGFEIAARMGRVMNPAHYLIGWHCTATVGTLGATAAAAKLMRLNVDQVRTALAIATSLAGGSRQNFGTMTKPFHAGNAARNGILAAQLSKKGLTADANILESPLGFCHLFGGPGQYNLDLLTNGLGDSWELLESGVWFKQYPTCGGTHAALDAMIHLIQVHDLKPDDVEQVEVTVDSIVPQVLIHEHPKSGLEGKFSMQYCLSIALIDRQVGLGQFTDAKVNQPLTHDLIDKVRVVAVDPASNGTPTTVKVTLRNGKSVSHVVNHPKGAPEDPVGDNVIARKYLDCAAFALGPDEAVASLELMRDLEDLAEIGPLMAIVNKRKGTPIGKEG